MLYNVFDSLYVMCSMINAIYRRLHIIFDLLRIVLFNTVKYILLHYAMNYLLYTMYIILHIEYYMLYTIYCTLYTTFHILYTT